MKVLVFDTETTGLPLRNKYGKKACIYETTLWPYIIQLSYILYDTEKSKIVIEHDHIVKIPRHCKLTEKSVELHGITRERSIRDGISIKEALDLFSICVNAADVIVAHNLSFDRQMMLVEYIRNNKCGPFMFKDPLQFYCTMKNSVDLCCIKATNRKTGELYNKFPRLDELHKYLFKEKPENTHNSFVDVLICLRCYMMMAHEKDIRDQCSRFSVLYRKVCPR